MCLFQIAEERISLGYVLVDMGFDILRITFKVINHSFLALEPMPNLVKLLFTKLFLPFCRHDLRTQLLNGFANSFARLLVAEVLKHLI